MGRDPSTSPSDAPAIDAQTFACHAARALADGRCEDVLVLDVRGLSQVTDFFVLATGTSDRQLQSAGVDLKHLGQAEQMPLFRSAGQGDGWVVMDFVNVVAHLFSAEQRAYYDLESLWGDARRLRWQTRTRPGQFARLTGRQEPAGRIDPSADAP